MKRKRWPTLHHRGEPGTALLEKFTDNALVRRATYTADNKYTHKVRGASHHIRENFLDYYIEEKEALIALRIEYGA